MGESSQAQHVPLDSGELLALARTTTGLDDLGEAEWPGWEETYRRFMATMDEEVDLSPLGRVATRAEALRVVQTWLRLQEHWTVTPDVRTESVEAPLFVLGPAGTGTTFLRELLALDPQMRAPLAWEALHPLPHPIVSADAELSESEHEQRIDVDPGLLAMQELRADLPCECIHFLSYDFGSPYWAVFYDTSSFHGWSLDHIDHLVGRMYRLHRRFLQTLQHGGERRRWLLKSPAHLATLPALFAEYPDARMVCTHRDPRRFVASVAAGALHVLGRMRNDPVDVAKFVPSMLGTYQLMLEQVIELRGTGQVPDDQIVDCHFLDLMADPVRALRRIYDQLGLGWPVEHDATIRRYLAAKPPGRPGARRLDLEDLALCDDAVRDAFAVYVDHYSVGKE